LFWLSLDSVLFPAELFLFATSSPCCCNYLLLPILAVATHTSFSFHCDSFVTSSSSYHDLFATSSSSYHHNYLPLPLLVITTCLLLPLLLLITTHVLLPLLLVVIHHLLLTLLSPLKLFAASSPCSSQTISKFLSFCWTV